MTVPQGVGIELAHEEHGIDNTVPPPLPMMARSSVEEHIEGAINPPRLCGFRRRVTMRLPD